MQEINTRKNRKYQHPPTIRFFPIEPDILGERERERERGWHSRLILGKLRPSHYINRLNCRLCKGMRLNLGPQCAYQHRRVYWNAHVQIAARSDRRVFPSSRWMCVLGETRDRSYLKRDNCTALKFRDGYAFNCGSMDKHSKI